MRAVARTPKGWSWLPNVDPRDKQVSVSPLQVGQFNDLVDRATGTTLSLHVRLEITAETMREGYNRTCQPTKNTLEFYDGS